MLVNVATGIDCLTGDLLLLATQKVKFKFRMLFYSPYSPSPHIPSGMVPTTVQMSITKNCMLIYCSNNSSDAIIAIIKCCTVSRQTMKPPQYIHGAFPRL